MPKRLFDVCAATALAVTLSPLLLVLSLLVRYALGRPIFFRQWRAGLHGRPFMMIKFRTMTDMRGADGVLLPDGERITTVGRMLRELSLDELPELWNVVRGDMSLVGPRPLPTMYLERYTPVQARRHDVRPGITGWAQVNGRNAISWDQKFALDLWYIAHRSLTLDVRILLITLTRFASRSHPGAAATPEFQGTHPR